MFLATTALTEFWDISDQLLFLGSWCIPYDQRDKWSKLDYRVISNPWNKLERVHQASRYCEQVIEYLLEELATYLNNIHGVNFGSRYWRILLGPWLLDFVEPYYDRYITIVEAFNTFPNLKTWLLEEKCYVTPCDYAEFTSIGFRGDQYNLQLYSQIIRSLGYSFPSKEQCSRRAIAGELLSNNKDISNNELPNNVKVIKKLVKKPWAHLFHKLFLSNNVLFNKVYLDQRQQLKLILTPGFQGDFLNAIIPSKCFAKEDPASKTRIDLADINDREDAFLGILIRNLPINFPALYLEGYNCCRQWVLDHFKGRSFPKVLFSMAGMWSDEFAKFLAAEMTETQNRLVVIQHGGGYGVNFLMGVERQERKISDRYYCWGWSGQEEDPKLISLPSPNLYIPMRKPGSSSQLRMCLMIGTTYPRYFYRFQSHPLGLRWEQYLQSTLDFLQEIGERMRREIVYRGHIIEFGWFITERIRDQFPTLTIDKHLYPFRAQMEKARLMIFDHPSTTFLEAMAGNVPSLIFFDPSAWEMRQPAQQFYDRLQAVGIFHHTPQSAARKLKEVYDNVDDWWFSYEVQQERQDFANHFALTSKDWNKHWVKMIRRELNEISYR